MQKIVLAFLILMSFRPLVGQEVLIFEDLRGDTLLPKFGMNRDHFGHMFFGFYKIAGTPELTSDTMDVWRSWAFDCGYRYKRRFSQVLSAGAEFGLKKMSYAVRHWEMLQTPEATEINKHKMIFLQTGLSLYQRFNYDKRRGNYVGNYIDLGIYCDWNWNVRQLYYYQNNTGEKVRLRKSNLNYIHPFDLGVLMRFGFNKLAVKTTYRLSHHFKETSSIGELPKFSFGVEFGMFAL